MSKLNSKLELARAPGEQIYQIGYKSDTKVIYTQLFGNKDREPRDKLSQKCNEIIHV